jgi:hypothetical protein
VKGPFINDGGGCYASTLHAQRTPPAPGWVRTRVTYEGVALWAPSLAREMWLVTTRKARAAEAAEGRGTGGPAR